MKSSPAQLREESSAPVSDDADDLVWGAKNIGSEINRSVSQVDYLFGIGALDGAVTKLGHKTLLGSRKRLRNLVTLNSKKVSAA